MTQWSLAQLLTGLHEDIQERLERVRKSFGHPGTKGDASEGVWLQLLETYLPKRYLIAQGKVVDFLGNESSQLDIIVLDAANTIPFYVDAVSVVVPIESVFAVVEVKTRLTAKTLSLALDTISSVHKLQYSEGLSLEDESIEDEDEFELSPMLSRITPCRF